MGSQHMGRNSVFEKRFPERAITRLFRVLSQAVGCLLDFDPEFHAVAARAKLHSPGSVDLLGLHAADWGRTATEMATLGASCVLSRQDISDARRDRYGSHKKYPQAGARNDCRSYDIKRKALPNQIRLIEGLVSRNKMRMTHNPPAQPEIVSSSPDCDQKQSVELVVAIGIATVRRGRKTQ